ncbi:MAG: phosphoglycerate dehydrogenase [Gammaproteobacteria bacterium]
MPFKICTLNNIAAAGLDRFSATKYEVAADVDQPDAYILRSADMHTMTIPDSVLAVARAGAGTNNIPVDSLSNRGIPVFNAPGANANAVKELVIAGMLLACRNILQAWEFGRQLDGDNDSIHAAVEKGKKQFIGFELPGKTLGVVGLGAIGVQVANSAEALSMNVIGFDPKITVERAWQLSSQVAQAANITDLLTRADFVTVHVPLLDETRNLISAERVAQMKQAAVLLNFARKGIVEESAVKPALDSGQLYSYVTDFPSKDLKNHPRVIALPHLGASTREAEENCAIMVAENLREFLEQGNIRATVNFPDVTMPRNGNVRLAVANANVPNMVGQITTFLAEEKLNIVDLINKSRGDLAYTLIDVQAPIATETFEKIRAIEGVLSARLIEAR